MDSLGDYTYTEREKEREVTSNLFTQIMTFQARTAIQAHDHYLHHEWIEPRNRCQT
jgi:hypothetical protein